MSPYLHLEQPNLIFFGLHVSASVWVAAADGRLKAQPAAAGRFMTAGASSTLPAAIRSNIVTVSTADVLTAGLAGDAESKPACDSGAAASPIANSGVTPAGGITPQPGKAYAAEAWICCCARTGDAALIGEFPTKSGL